MKLNSKIATPGKNWRDKWKTVIILIFLNIWMLYLIRGLSKWTDREDIYLPAFAIGVVIVLSSIKIIKIIIDNRSGEMNENRRNNDEWADSNHSVQSGNARSNTGSSYDKNVVVLALMIGGFPFSVYYLGFSIGFTAYFFVFSIYTLRDLKKSIILTISFSVIYHILVVGLLNMVLWEGVIW